MKILIIRFSSIGDIVLTSPVPRCLHEQLGAEIHYLTKAAYKDILLYNPHIHKVWTMDDKGLATVLPALRKERFDHIIDLHKNLRSMRTRAVLNTPSYSFNKLNPQKWLLVNFKINRLPDLHIVDRYMAAVAGLGVRNDGEGLDFFVSATAKAEAETFLEQLRGSGLDNGYTAIVIGAKFATKAPSYDWLLGLLRRMPGQVLLIGGPAEREKGESLARMTGGHVHNAAGELGIGGSAELIRRSDAVISPDTGMMHIAAAFQKEIISLWGNTVPEFGMHPYMAAGMESRSHIIENKNPPCRPCSKLGYGECPKGHFSCMEDLKADGVLKLLIQLKKRF